MRDLKADLEELHSLMQSADDWENMQNFIRAFGDEWLNQALAEKERADRSEALVRELVECLDVMFSEAPMSVWLEAKIQLEELHGKAKEVLGDGLETN